MSHLTQSAAARKARLARKLKGALVVRQDKARGLNLAWFGDKRIVVFAEDGFEVSFWRVKAPRRNPRGNKSPYAHEVTKDIERVIETGEYPDRVRGTADDSDA